MRGAVVFSTVCNGLLIASRALSPGVCNVGVGAVTLLDLRYQWFD